MEITQSYSNPSTATLTETGGLRLSVSTELSRPGVSLDAQVIDSLAYARVMLALYAVVSSDLRTKQKDHAAYQRWVQARYLEELDAEMGLKISRLPALTDRRGQLKGRIAEIAKDARPLESSLEGPLYFQARSVYFKWLWNNDKDAWMILDPVVSVHPDCVVFEVFSIDESSYGRVTVPMDKLDTLGEVRFGTTNVDYSRALADEIRRVRSYRPAFLSVNSGGVAIATGAGERLEKKIDLPPTWVRGFLQVQSAATFAGTQVTLSASTVAEVLSALRRRREDSGPRSLKFVLVPGKKPSIIIEPWNITIDEPEFVFDGDFTGEIRIWGRRRLLALEDLLPTADKVEARLLGTGMPSYWTVFQKSHRFDLGLSGWTKNDWSRAARFDLLAATKPVSDGDVAQAAQLLGSKLRLTPAELAAISDLTQDSAASALQRLCRQGMAMYDLAGGVYRWRQLLPFPVPEDESDQRMNLARRIAAAGGVVFRMPGEDDEEKSSFGMPATDESIERFRASVRGGETRREHKFNVVIDLDNDGRVRFAQCDCSFYRREKLRQGPCPHILATAALASSQSVRAGAVKSAGDSGVAAGSSAALNPDRFKGMNFVFTGALTLFTREQAEAIVEQGGGKASGSVSRNTTYLVAGDRAGSKLTKARDLGVPVLTEQQFQDMREGKAV